jgi:hypothetical protein
MAAMFAYPMWRPFERARIEMLWLCAAAYALLPVLNLVTTARGLDHSLPQGDWIMAGFDLASLGCAFIAGACALKVRRSLAGAPLRRRPARARVSLRAEPREIA